MKNLKYALFSIFFVATSFISCYVSKNEGALQKGRAAITTQNEVGSEKGWYVISTEKSKHTPSEYLTMRLHNAESPTDTIRLSVLTVNGVDLTTEGSQKAVRVVNGVYKIQARAYPFYPIEVTIRKKAGYDIFVDFYMKIQPRYMNAGK